MTEASSEETEATRCQRMRLAPTNDNGVQASNFSAGEEDQAPVAPFTTEDAFHLLCKHAALTMYKLYEPLRAAGLVPDGSVYHRVLNNDNPDVVLDFMSLVTALMTLAERPPEVSGKLLGGGGFGSCFTVDDGDAVVKCMAMERSDLISGGIFTSAVEVALAVLYTLGWIRHLPDSPIMEAVDFHVIPCTHVTEVNKQMQEHGMSDGFWHAQGSLETNTGMIVFIKYPKMMCDLREYTWRHLHKEWQGMHIVNVVQLVEISAQVFAGMLRLHRLCIIYNDVKSGNLLVAKQATARGKSGAGSVRVLWADCGAGTIGELGQPLEADDALACTDTMIGDKRRANRAQQDYSTTARDDLAAVGRLLLQLALAVDDHEIEELCSCPYVLVRTAGLPDEDALSLYAGMGIDSDEVTPQALEWAVNIDKIWDWAIQHGGMQGQLWVQQLEVAARLALSDHVPDDMWLDEASPLSFAQIRRRQAELPAEAEVLWDASFLHQLGPVDERLAGRLKKYVPPKKSVVPQQSHAATQQQSSAEPTSQQQPSSEAEDNAAVQQQDAAQLVQGSAEGNVKDDASRSAVFVLADAVVRSSSIAPPIQPQSLDGMQRVQPGQQILARMLEAPEASMRRRRSSSDVPARGPRTMRASVHPRAATSPASAAGAAPRRAAVDRIAVQRAAGEPMADSYRPVAKSDEHLGSSDQLMANSDESIADAMLPAQLSSGQAVAPHLQQHVHRTSATVQRASTTVQRALYMKMASSVLPVRSRSLPAQRDARTTNQAVGSNMPTRRRSHRRTSLVHVAKRDERSVMTRSVEFSAQAVVPTTTGSAAPASSGYGTTAANVTQQRRAKRKPGLMLTKQLTTPAMSRQRLSGLPLPLPLRTRRVADTCRTTTAPLRVMRSARPASVGQVATLSEGPAPSFPSPANIPPLTSSTVVPVPIHMAPPPAPSASTSPPSSIGSSGVPAGASGSSSGTSDVPAVTTDSMSASDSSVGPRDSSSTTGIPSGANGSAFVTSADGTVPGCTLMLQVTTLFEGPAPSLPSPANMPLLTGSTMAPVPIHIAPPPAPSASTSSPSSIGSSGVSAGANGSSSGTSDIPAVTTDSMSASDASGGPRDSSNRSSGISPGANDSATLTSTDGTVPGSTLANSTAPNAVRAHRPAWKVRDRSRRRGSNVQHNTPVPAPAAGPKRIPTPMGASQPDEPCKPRQGKWRRACMFGVGALGAAAMAVVVGACRGKR